MKMMKTAALTLAGILLASLLAAQTPEGPEIPVNTLQGITLTSDVATMGNGDFIVVWEGRDPTGPYRAWARRFSAQGKPRGREVPVDPSSRGMSQELPVVAVTPGGSFIIAWQSTDSFGEHGIVFVRCFSAGGRALGPARRANPGSGSVEQNPAVAAAPDGSFIALWSSFSSPYEPQTDGILARRFAADGKPLGPAFQIAPPAVDFQAYPRVAASGNGGFLAGWQSYLQSGGLVIVAQRLDAEGHSLGDPSRASSGPIFYNGHTFAMAVTDAGESLFVWVGSQLDTPPDSSGSPPLGILGQRLAADGTRLGKPFLIYDGAPGLGDPPAVAALPSGGYFVAWSTLSLTKISGRSISSDGSQGAELQISGSPKVADYPAVAIARNGGGVVTWNVSRRETSPILFRRLAPEP